MGPFHRIAILSMAQLRFQNFAFADGEHQAPHHRHAFVFSDIKNRHGLGLDFAVAACLNRTFALIVEQAATENFLVQLGKMQRVFQDVERVVLILSSETVMLLRWSRIIDYAVTLIPNKKLTFVICACHSRQLLEYISYKKWDLPATVIESEHSDCTGEQSGGVLLETFKKTGVISLNRAAHQES